MHSMEQLYAAQEQTSITCTQRIEVVPDLKPRGQAPSHHQGSLLLFVCGSSRWTRFATARRAQSAYCLLTSVQSGRQPFRQRRSDGQARPQSRKRGLRGGPQPTFHLLVTRKPGLLHNRLATIQHNEVRNAAHIEARGQVGIAFSVHLDHDRAALHFFGSARNFRSCHAAGTAPHRPEIHQYWDSRLLDNVVQQIGICFQRFSNGIQARFASSAASSIGKTFHGNTVLATACFAGSKDGHEHPPSATCRRGGLPAHGLYPTR